MLFFFYSAIIAFSGLQRFFFFFSFLPIPPPQLSNMPLSADSILGFFDGSTRRCQVFEHVALVAAGPFTTASASAASLHHARGTSVHEVDAVDLVAYGGNNGLNSSGAAHVIPVATGGPQPMSWAAESKGTLYICAMPEMMWNSIAAVTATSAPSQRQLAFSIEAPAFSPSRSQSFVQSGQNSPRSATLKRKTRAGGAPVREAEDDRWHSGGGWQDRNTRLADEELPEMSAFGAADDSIDNTRTPPRQTQTAKRHVISSPPRRRDLMSSEDPRYRQDPPDHIPPRIEVSPSLRHIRSGSSGGGCGVDEGEGIQLPDMTSTMRNQLASSVLRSDSIVDRADLRAYQAVAAAGAGTLSPPLSTASNGAAAISSLCNLDGGTMSAPASVMGDTFVAAGTVTVLLWVAADASAVGEGLTDGERIHTSVSPLRQTVAGSPRSSGSHTDVQGLQGFAKKGGVDGNGAMTVASTGPLSPRGSLASAPSPSSLPACLCLSVGDIVEAESGDTDVITSRERRVQRFTLMLEAGAPVYTAKSTSDIFESAAAPVNGSASVSGVENGSRGGPFNASISTLSYSACLRPRPTGGLSCTFVFYQGGITRCVASLRSCSPRLAYACLGSRHNNSSSALTLPGDTGGVSSAALSQTTNAQFGTQEASSLVDMRDSLSAGPANGGGPCNDSTPLGIGDAALKSLLPSSQSSQTQLAQSQGTKSGGGGGWQSRLSPAALFRHNKHAEAAPPPPSLERTQVPMHSTSPAPIISPGPGATLTNSNTKANGQCVGSTPPKGDSAGKKQRKGPERALPGDLSASGGRKNNNSSSSSFEDLTDEMTAVRLGACYVPPKPSLPPVEPGACGGGPITAAEWEAVFDAAPQNGPTAGTTIPAISVVVEDLTSKQGRVLNADRWRVLRQRLFERGGIADSSIRFEVWCYLLGAYSIGCTAADQQAILAKEEDLYARLTTQWKSFLPEQEEHFAAYRDAKHAILKDAERTDRTHPAFRGADSDMLRVLQELLLAHVMYNMDLGYSQGMSDVAAVASLVAPAAHEAAMFLCLRKMLSEHMESNFVIEERKKNAPYAAVNGLQRKLYQVQVLTRHFHPRLYGHLKMRCMAEDMTFCFRWLLVCFKRDLGSLADTMRFWDVLFACPYTKSYEVVVTVALLVALAPQIITHIHTYETLQQFVNALSSGTSVDQILQSAREFYENVCVVETLELRRQRHRRTTTHVAAAAATGQAPVPDLYNDSQAKPAVARSPVTESADDTRYPTVEEMVLLFLETDGPL